MGRAIRDEITSDPLGRGYAGMTDQEVADSLNAPDRSLPRDSLDAQTLLDAVDITEVLALNPNEEARFWSILDALGDRGATPDTIEAILQDIFSPGNSRTGIARAKQRPVSRAEELGIGFVKPGHVEAIRG